MASARKKTRRKSGGNFAIFAIIVAMAAVLIWEIGCSRQTKTGMNTSTPTSSSPVVTENRHHSESELEPPKEDQTAQEDKKEQATKSEDKKETSGEESTDREGPEAIHAESPSMAPDIETPTPNMATPAPETPSQEQPSPETPSPRATPRPVPGRAARIFVHGNRGGNRVAITFDAGASPAPTPKILDVLNRHHTTVTFFLTGKWVKQNPGLAHQIAQAGHEIGNHSYSHPQFTHLTDAKIKSELDRTEELINDNTGLNAKPLFRPPFGSYNKHVLETLGANGYTDMIYWSLDSWDSVKVGITSKEISNRVLGKVRGGDIILMHCGSQASADALDGILNTLESRGYQVVPVTELLGL